MMHAMIFEPQFAGHNLAYVRHIIQALLGLGVKVTLATSNQASKSQEFERNLGEFRSSFELRTYDLFSDSSSGKGVRVNGPGGLFSSLRCILDGLKSCKPDHFYLPFGNPLAHAMGLPNPVSKYLRDKQIEAEIVLLFGKYAYAHNDLASRAKQEIALRLLANGPWARIHHIVPHAIDVMHSHRSRLPQIAHLLADPVDPPPSAMSKSQARSMLGLCQDSSYVSLLGLIDQRKGVGDLLAAAQRLEGSKTKILLAGKNSQEARQLLAGKYRSLVESGKVLVRDEHLSPTQLWAACIASDLITTPYPNHRYSASILIRAAAVGVPVLANRIGWMGDVTERYALGWTCPTQNPVLFASKIQEVLDRSEVYTPSAASRQFVEFHTLANFQSQITNRISKRLAFRVGQVTQSHC
jgi:glycosyltransferase involved in cell wall biosynthesis